MLTTPFKYYTQWLDKTAADNIFNHLLENLPWQEETIAMFGKQVKVPRKIVWLADENLTYTYSGVAHQPQPLPLELKQLRDKINSEFHLQLNSVLCNLYHNGKDYMGWHQDNEKELGVNPTIASISLGATRKFSLRHKITQQKIDLLLEHGSLLIMLPGCQTEWQHCLPKMLRCNMPRINLTFRKIV